MRKALVIDDARTAADLLVLILKSLGIEGHAAYGPGPGLALLRAGTPDVVFLDIIMPGLSGFEIFADTRLQIRACEAI